MIKGSSGPIRTILMGDRIVDRVACHDNCESDPRKDSGGWFNNEVVAKRKANAKTRNRRTNFFLEIFMVVCFVEKYFVFQST